MLSYLANLEEFWGPFRLFGYITLRSALAMVMALFIGFALAPWLFATLQKLKAAQSLRTAKEVGRLAELHAVKHNIPTMGGILIYLAIVPTVLLCAKFNVYVGVALLVYTGLTAIGFWDDYLKITRKSSKGLNGKLKFAGQGVLTVLSVGILLANSESHSLMRELWIPFYKYPFITEMPIWFILIFFFFVMAGSSHAINLTDGVDGLAIGCTIPAFLVYSIIAYFVGNTIISNYLNMNFISGASELTIVCSATIGAALVFLWYNSHPAEIFMGDTGSLGLGGLMGTIAFMVHEPFTLVIVGGVFVLEVLSVISQVASYKTFGRRIFRMAPIHHHFELKGWHENKVVIRFWIISLLFALAGLSTLKLR